MHLRPFQRTFEARATAPGVDLAACSMPRGNGKSWLAAHLLTRVLSPADPLWREGTESVLAAASLEQGRIVFRFVREALEDTGEYRFLDSHNRIGIVHRATNTRLRALGSNGKTAMGLVGCPWAVADEPGAWEVRGGQLLHDAIETAKGKPGSKLRSLYIGTLAPAQSGWWHDLIAKGTHVTTYVMALQGDRATWDTWPTIRKANPLVEIDAGFRRKLLQERDAARTDSRLKARFLSYRLNLPTSDEDQVLLTVEDWQRVVDRDVPARVGRPIVAVDIGANRAWSAAAAIWRNGRAEALAVCPGSPSVEAQERRDRVPRGTYQALVDARLLMPASGLHVPRVSSVLDAVRRRWGTPEFIIADRFKFDQIIDCAPGCRVEARVTRWSESTADIDALRRAAADGPLSVDPGSRPLIETSLARCVCKSDDAGNVRMVKDNNNTGRDDVGAALVLAAGALDRAPVRRAARLLGVA